MFQFAPTAFDLLCKNLTQQRFITTYSKSLDELLHGGISLGQITELCGTSGAGKTQLSLQACLTVQLPEESGGVAGRAIYLDTEGCFSTRRLIHLAEYHLNFLSQFNTPLTAASTLNSPPVPVQKRQPTYNIERFGSPLLLSTSTSANAQLEKTSDHFDGRACYRIAFSQPPPPNGCCGRSPGIDPTPSVTPVADAPDAESMPKRICLSPLTPTRMSISSVAAQNQLHDSKSASPPPDAAVAGVEVENENENQKPELTIGALNAVANEQNERERLSSLPPSVRALFDNVDCVRVRDAAQLVRALDCVEEELERDSAAATATAPTPTPLRNRPPLKLLVVDSVAAVLRPSCVEQPAQWESALDPKHVNTDELLNKRTQYMNTIAVQLTRIAKKHELAVLVVNQLTSNETSQSRESQFQPHPQPEWAGAEPALGESWSHVCSLRVALARDPSSAAPGVRVACLLKDLARAACSKSARFQIAAEGVRDLLI